MKMHEETLKRQEELQKENNERILQISNLVENVEDELLKFRDENDKSQKLVEEIKSAYLNNATEKTIAHYFDLIAESVQRELGTKPVHNQQKLS